MNPTIAKLYHECLAVAGSPDAAATLVLAQLQTRALNNAPSGALLNLTEAAAYLGYDAAGMRKIVRQRRIQYLQNGRGPIKFRREWLDEFISANARGPQDTKRSLAHRRKPDTTAPPRFGLDTTLLRPRNHISVA